MTLLVFRTKEDLLTYYACELKQQAIKHYGRKDKNHTDPCIFELMAKTAIKYTPHLYNGGWVIPGFGYSTERIGKFVSETDLVICEKYLTSPVKIGATKMLCKSENCHWSGVVDSCLPDIDGEGSLGCPKCKGYVNEPA